MWWVHNSINKYNVNVVVIITIAIVVVAAAVVVIIICDKNKGDIIAFKTNEMASGIFID